MIWTRMKPQNWVRSLLGIALIVLTVQVASAAQPADASSKVEANSDAESVSFMRDIRPILSNRCFACHGFDAAARESDLRLDVADGPHGAHKSAIVPGDVQASKLWKRINSTDEFEVMPPPTAHKEPLTKDEKELIRQWIAAGAVYEKFWAFGPVKAPETPRVKNRSWSQQPVDLHVLARLESLKRSPSKEADPRTLIRRVTFDLTGLPPTREEIRKFLADWEQSKEQAWEDLVERLLGTPQYGEHMARYWLDLVRFADTNGMHKDFYRNHVEYRDWVIRSFNQNLPYSDFLKYQLAGDLYPEPTEDQLIASGFNRLHLIIDRGTALPEESFHKNVVDRVTAVGTSFLGLTVQCAQCHDHKYDPITQKDFYSLYAFFNNIDAAPETSGGPRNGLQPPFRSFPDKLQQEQMRKLDAEFATIQQKIAQNQQQSPQTVEQLQAELKQVQNQRKQLESAFRKAMVMKERQEVRPTFLLKRGEYQSPGEAVERNTPAFLPPLKKSGQVASRMDLAEWFVDPDHPLTARVAVNRIWQQFFGVGLVKTSEDLGAQGEPPSHAELLDYLTHSFVESGWDVKRLVKQIVLSKTYRQTSKTTREQFESDRNNRLLARGSRFRMDAEMIRDQVLLTSGLLSQKMYGPSVKPPQPDGLWKAVTMIGERFRADTGEAARRRSVYTYWKRGLPPPQMTIMNAPIRDSCIARRERTNTSSQALLLLNEPEYFKAARSLALLVLVEDEGDRIGVIWETVTSQLPDAREQKMIEDLLTTLQAKYATNSQLADEICEGVQVPEGVTKVELAAWSVLANTLYNLDITKTRQ